MKAKTIILTIILFVLIVVGMFVYAKLKKAEQSASVGHIEDLSENTQIV